MNKISIIGTGYVGSTIAYTLTVMGVASEIVLVDINHEKAEGEALDIRQGTPFCGSCSVYAGKYEDMKDSNIIIFSCGVARKPGQSRLELAQVNVNITKSVIPEIEKYAPNAVVIIVSNPVDILTYTFHKFSNLPENQIIGSGTILDTARLRARLSEHFSINQKNVHAYVFGEHGDSSFVPWSIASISNVPIEECVDAIRLDGEKVEPLDFAEVEEYVRRAGSRVIDRKGATFYAVSVSVCHICKALLSGIDTVMSVSTYMHGEYGISDVCLSTLNVVGHNGIRSKVHVKLKKDEIFRLRASANTLKDVIKNLDI